MGTSDVRICREFRQLQKGKSVGDGRERGSNEKTKMFLES